MEWLRTLRVCPRQMAGRRDTAQDHAESANDGPHGRHVNPQDEVTESAQHRELQFMMVLANFNSGGQSNTVDVETGTTRPREGCDVMAGWDADGMVVGTLKDVAGKDFDGDSSLVPVVGYRCFLLSLPLSR